MAHKKKADLPRILEGLEVSRSFLECAARSLEADAERKVGPELTCLMHGLLLLGEAYIALDRAIGRG